MHNKRNSILIACAGLLAMGYGPLASAFSFSWNDFDIEVNSKFTVGGGWRIEERDEELLGILNVPGQQDLCRADDCLSFDGNPEPAQRLKKARGGFALHLADDGNMNYDKGDMYAGTAKFDSTATVSWEDYLLKVSGIAYYDRANAIMKETNFNTDFQPASEKRRGRIQNRLSKHSEIREAYVGGVFAMPFLGDRDLNVSVGKQRLRWGEANLHLFNTLDFINPLDATLARQPGLDLASLQIPTNMILLGTDITDTVAIEAFYQYKWEPTRPDPSGSFFSTFDAAGGGDYVNAHLGQFAEDPYGNYQSQGLLGLFSSTTTLFRLDDEHIGDPDDGGQYGVKLSWYAEDFMNGTEFGFYYANYHSRLPNASAFAAEYSCVRDAAIPGDFASAFVACNGFNGSAIGSPVGREPFPVDTGGLFLDYPEDNQLFGISFNTNVGDWSLAGEYVFHKDQPVQIHLSDVLFSLARNATGEQDIPVGPGAFADPLLSGLPAPLNDVLNTMSSQVPMGGIIIPGQDNIFPAFMNKFRGREYLPGEYIPGFERLDVNQLVLTGIKIFSSSNPIKADQIIFLVEGGATYVSGMPKEGDLYFQGAGDFTHPSPGGDGSGQKPGDPTRVTLNPTQQRDGFADRFSWGLRTLIRATYNDVWGLGINLEPTVIAFADIDGIAPFPAQNYVEDNIFIVPGVFFEIGQSWSGTLLYQYLDGERNLLRDRDNVSFSVTYSF